MLILLVVYTFLFKKYEAFQKYFDFTLILAFAIFTIVINRPVEGFEFFSAYFLAASMYIGIIIFKRFILKIIMAAFSITYTVIRVYEEFDEKLILFLYYMIMSTFIMLVYIYNSEYKIMEQYLTLEKLLNDEKDYKKVLNLLRDSVVVYDCDKKIIF